MFPLKLLVIHAGSCSSLNHHCFLCSLVILSSPPIFQSPRSEMSEKGRHQLPSLAWNPKRWQKTPHPGSCHESSQHDTHHQQLMWRLQTVRAIRANGYLSALENIPQEFVDILCEGPTDGLDLNLRRELTINGLVLPSEGFWVYAIGLGKHRDKIWSRQLTRKHGTNWYRLSLNSSWSLADWPRNAKEKPARSTKHQGHGRSRIFPTTMQELTRNWNPRCWLQTTGIHLPEKDQSQFPGSSNCAAVD